MKATLTTLLWLLQCNNLLLLRATAFSLKAPVEPKKTFLQRVDQFLTKLQKPEEQRDAYLYLQGNYAPVSEEHTNVPVEVVSGELPSTLDGLLVRNGPNPDNTLMNKKRYHWFDGHGMLHCLRLQNGRATYTNQFVPSARYKIEKQLGEEYFATLGEFKGFPGLIKAVISYSLARDYISDLNTVAPPNTSCLMYNNKFYCLNEGNIPLECKLLPDGRLEYIGYETFNSVLDFPISAHPRIDNKGDLLFHSYTTNVETIEEQGTMKVGRYCSEQQKIVSYFVPTEDKSYVSFAHNLIFTDNYSIIWDCSVHFDTTAMFEGGSYFKTKPEFNLRFGIVPKYATSKEETVWIDTGGPGAIVHPLNSWEEEDGTIVIWTPFCEDLNLDLDTDEINTFLMMEYRLDPSTGTVIDRQTIDSNMNVEFSVVATMGKKVRYGYTAIQCQSTPGEGTFSGFCIWDMGERRMHKAIYYQDGEVGGEPIVIKDDVSRKEYVGVYTCLFEDQTYFVLFDGENGEEVTRLKMPHRVPFGFHGLWLSGEELSGHHSHISWKEIRSSFEN
ncbi:hypothetical protein ACHAWC_005411 [Mediolabrus comicus]